MSSRKHWFLRLIAALSLLALCINFVHSSFASGTKTPTPQPTKAVPLSGKLTPRQPDYSKTNILLAFSKGVPRQQRRMIEGTVQAHEVRALGIDNAYLITVASGHVL